MWCVDIYNISHLFQFNCINNIGWKENLNYFHRSKIDKTKNIFTKNSRI